MLQFQDWRVKQAKAAEVRTRTAADLIVQADGAGPPLDDRTVAAIRAVPGSEVMTSSATVVYTLEAAGLQPSPDRSAVVPVERGCPPSDRWTYRQPLVFPDPWRRRAIEGWAIVTFDVAPWGEVGNTRVVASEPAAAFGEQAVRLLRGATKPASATGYSGCFERVRFVLDAKAAAAPADY